jgi:hypothetical protein
MTNHLVLAALLAIAAGSYACSPAVDTETCEALRAAGTQARAEATSRGEQFTQAFLAASALQPAPDAPQCPHTRLPWMNDRVAGPSSRDTWMPDAISTLTGLAEQVDRRDDSCGLGDIIGQQNLTLEIRTYIESLQSGYDLVVAEVSRIEPELVTGTTFNPGSLVAQVLVYSHAEQAFVCAGTVAATNRDEVLRGGLRGIDDLNLDLNRQASQAARDALRSLTTP